MARKYSGDKGKSGSKKILGEHKPSWLRYKSKEIEMLVVKLAKKGLSTSEIGIALRDSYGIPSIKMVTGKKIGKILEQKGVTSKLPEDLLNLIKKSVYIREHLEENHKDNTAKRGLQLTESKIMSLVKYYKKTKKVAQDWNYNPKNAKLFLE